RERELKEYTEYVSSYFASVHPSAHWKVFNLDKAIRKRVGSVNNGSLNEFSKFWNLKTRYLNGHGAGKSGEPSMQKASERSGAGTNWSQMDPCRLWNEGKCNKKASTCKYRHVF